MFFIQAFCVVQVRLMTFLTVIKVYFQPHDL